jgi:polyphosphate kinase
MSTRKPGAFLNREISWLEFNRRVLEEAQDPQNPLLERLRFFCIFHANLDEFFMVRVASLQHQMEQGDDNPDPSGLTPHQQLELIFTRVREAYEISRALYSEELIPALAKENIHIRTLDHLKPAQEKYLDEFFEKEAYPVLTPVAVDDSHPFPWLPGLTLNLAFLLQPDRGEAAPRLAVVQVPGRLPGLFRVPAPDALEMCWLSDAVRRRSSDLFPGYRVVEVAGFRLARDSELYLNDEDGSDYVGMLESGLKKRRRAKPIRLEHEEMSPELLGRIQTALEVRDSGLFSTRGPLEPRPLLSIVDMPGYEHLHYRPQPPLPLPDLGQERNIFDVLRERDILLYHPYDSFDPVVGFIEAAADDPDVLAIKQTLYRTSGKGSPVVGALIRAAEAENR